MATYTYKGYKIVKRYIDPLLYGVNRHVWDVLIEVQGRCHLTGRVQVKWRVTYTGKTLKECKRAIRAGFGRL